MKVYDSETHKAIKVPASVVKDVRNTAGGLYSMNAPYAKWYSFSHNDKEIVRGEFMGISDQNHLDEYMCYIEMAKK